jgi:hypothetical protein
VFDMTWRSAAHIASAFTSQVCDIAAPVGAGAPSRRMAGVGAWEELSPYSLRHSAITFALDAGATLQDVQDYAGHKDPRTTRLHRRCLSRLPVALANSAIRRILCIGRMLLIKDWDVLSLSKIPG